MGRLRGAPDLARREPERERHDRRVEADGPRPVQRRKPHLVALGDRRDRRLEDERRLQRPGRVPGAAADEHDPRPRLGTARTAAGPCSTSGSIGPTTRPAARRPASRDAAAAIVARLVARPQARQVELDDRATQAVERGPRERVAGRSRPLPEVDQRHVPGDRPGEDVDVADLGRDRVDAEGLDRRVRRVVAEEMGGDPVRDPQRPRQERPIGVLDDDQPAGDERAQRPQARPAWPGAGTRPGAAQLERQPGARPPPRDVVVEVAVEPLEPRIEVRSERDEEQLDVVRVQPERSREPAQPEVRAGALGGVSVAFHRRERRGRRRVDVLGTQRPPGPARRPSTWASEMYRPRKRSFGSASSARRRSTAARTRASTSSRRAKRYASEASAIVRRWSSAAGAGSSRAGVVDGGAAFGVRPGAFAVAAMRPWSARAQAADPELQARIVGLGVRRE